MAGIRSIFLCCLCIASAGTYELTSRNCQTRLSALSQETDSNATAHWADRNTLLRKTQASDAMLPQQAEVGNNIAHKLRKQSVVSAFVKNANRREMTPHMGTS